MKTREHLEEAFAGESQANRKYLAFSKKAGSEGFEMVSRLFAAVAEAETIHAHKHLQVMGGVQSTLENLKGALEGETHEFTEMYPGFIADAEAEGEKTAKMSFHMANEAEKAHGGLFKKAVEAMETGKDFPAESFYLCPVCGYVEADHAPDKCPICNTPGKSFKQF